MSEWQLTPYERDYVDLQQGCRCRDCGANLRIIALGNAIQSAIGTTLTVRDAVGSGDFDQLRVLDCNGAEGLSLALSHLPLYQRADYPEYDMRRLPFDSDSFDLIIHSDTLEHIETPGPALEECRRVLAKSGHVCFTVPVIHGRMSRSRAGLQKSYHGAPGSPREDFVVHTEFGADVWTFLHKAGFDCVTINQVGFPAATAITAYMSPRIQSCATSVGSDDVTEVAAAKAVMEEQQTGADVPVVYDQDGLRSIHNHDFMKDQRFRAAYARGVIAAGEDYRWHWRVHTGLWAASTAIKIPGDFIEFGVNRGFLSSAIMAYLDWNSTGRRFYLLDTFSGIDERYISEDDLKVGVLERNRREIERGFYTFDIEAVRRNFSEWPKATLIQGSVPDTLRLIDARQIAFAHIDMNCSPPEIAAAEFIWPLLSPGAVILLDDYAYSGYQSQKTAMDEFAKRKGVAILALPTGQGMMVRPPRR